MELKITHMDSGQNGKNYSGDLTFGCTRNKLLFFFFTRFFTRYLLAIFFFFYFSGKASGFGVVCCCFWFCFPFGSFFYLRLDVTLFWKITKYGCN